MSFAISMVWRVQKNRYDDYYFCINDNTGFSSKNKHVIVYPDMESTCKPIQHDISLLIPIPMPQQINFKSEMVEDLEFAAKEVHRYCTDHYYVSEDELLVSS